ncbi:helix-turn-helix domain-containing protein [Cohnella sp. AR92]|uniref:LexA family protein n=1 Tax=Cohnella sp. AR92 TaxID=648716 RepID=UPI000F8EDA53|nr:helix-turn-helix domain-containing protein [Cohnella sp. AR92]RUS47553.1 hypothetical protein ELR57_07085 [Cohnella sp. AR92]
MKQPLTDKQLNVFRYIREYITDKGYSPTVREIARGVGLASTSSVARYLTELEDKGYIERREATPRAIALKGEGNTVRAVVTIVKAKKDIPTVIAVNGHEYVLRHPDEYKAPKRGEA